MRVEAFNVFDRAHLSNPSSNTASATFGQVTSVRRDPRVVQLGARFVF
jgi:hypothetical protein